MAGKGRATGTRPLTEKKQRIVDFYADRLEPDLKLRDRLVELSPLKHEEVKLALATSYVMLLAQQKMISAMVHEGVASSEDLKILSTASNAALKLIHELRVSKEMQEDDDEF